MCTLWGWFRHRRHRGILAKARATAIWECASTRTRNPIPPEHAPFRFETVAWQRVLSPLESLHSPTVLPRDARHFWDLLALAAAGKNHETRLDQVVVTSSPPKWPPRCMSTTGSPKSQLRAHKHQEKCY